MSAPVSIPFTGRDWCGFVEIGLLGDALDVLIASVPADPDARGARGVVAMDPTPDQADAIAAAFAEWAARARARQRPNEPPPLLALIGDVR